MSTLCQHAALGVVHRDRCNRCIPCHKSTVQDRYRSLWVVSGRWGRLACKHAGLGVVQRDAKSRCTLCHREKQRDRHRRRIEESPEKVRAYGRERTRARNGLRWAEGDSEARLRERCGNRCEICGDTQTLCVDHCHSTVGGPNVRGLLCNKHNWVLGLLGDSPDTLEKIAEYLQRGVFRGDFS